MIRKPRNSIHQTLRGKLESTSTKECLDIDTDINRKRIDFQMTPDMTLKNEEKDDLKPICMSDMANDEKSREAFFLEGHSTIIEKSSSTKGNGISVPRISTTIF